MKKAIYSFVISIIAIGVFLTGCESSTTVSKQTTNTPPQNSTTTNTPTPPNTDFSTYNPDPIKKIEHYDAAHMQWHFFDHADSVWLDGDWHDPKTGLFGPRYVATFLDTGNDPPKSVIEELDVNFKGRGHSDHVCPKPIGHITITTIDTDGPKKWMLIHFTSSTRVNGTLDLSNDQWTFNSN